MKGVKLLFLLSLWAIWLTLAAYAVVLVWFRVDGTAVFPVTVSLLVTVAWLISGFILFRLTKRSDID